MLVLIDNVQTLSSLPVSGALVFTAFSPGLFPFLMGGCSCAALVSRLFRISAHIRDRKLFYGLIREEQLYLVPLFQPFGTIAFSAVQRYVLFTHHFIDKTLAGLVQIFCEKLIQPLSGLILGNCQCLHMAALLCR